VSLRIASAAVILAVGGLTAQSVHLYPVVTDAGGHPVTDLTAADFKITDQGKAQSILFFAAPTAGWTEPLSAHEFSNRPGGRMPHATAILFDLMNEGDANRLEVWRRLAKGMGENEPGVYLYLLNLRGELVPIRPVSGHGEDLDKAMAEANVSRPAGMDREDRAKKTYHQMEVLANQLAVLPGRREIVWITNGVPSITNAAPCSGDWVECGLYVPHLATTLQNDGVAVDPDYYSGVPQPTASYDLEQMARLTGGRVIFGEDIRESLQQIASAAVGRYAISYTPAGGSGDNKFHTVQVKCERKGVKMQVRERYYALPDARPAEERQQEKLAAAVEGQTDAAGIGLRVKVSAAAKGVHIEIRMQIAGLLLKEHDGKMAGAMTMVVADLGSGGGSGLAHRPIGRPAVSEFALELTREQCERMATEGVPVAFDHALGEGARRMRIVLMDRGTDETGAITFPVR